MILGMLNKTKRIFPVSLRKPNKKTMKGGVACEGPSLFKWQANSCYLDSLLIGWLHFADADFLANLNRLDAAEPDGNKKNLIRKLIEVYNSLSRYGPPADPTRIREEFRDVLQTCVDITALMPRSSFKDTQDPTDIFSLITNYLDINDIELTNKYKGFRGHTDEEINILMGVNPDRNRNQINRFNPDLPEPPERPDDINYKNIVYLRPALGLIEPQVLINRPLEDKRNNIGNDMYYVEQKISGTVHGILPIAIDRNNNGRRDRTDIELQTHVDLEDGTYELVSVICYVPGHYVAYYKCNEGDNWIFYNDIGVGQQGGGTCEEDIRGIFQKFLSENNIGPLKYDGIMELDFIKGKFKESEYKELYNIILKYETKSNGFMSQLVEKLVRYICVTHTKFKTISHTIHRWYEKNREIVMRQWKEIIKSNIYSRFKSKSKSRSLEQENIVKIFEMAEKNRIVKIKELTEIIRDYYSNSFKDKPSSVSPSPFSSRSPSPEPAFLPKASALPPKASALLPKAPALARRENPIYTPIGPVDTWYNKNIPGYPPTPIKGKSKGRSEIIGYQENTPRNSATLLFYKKMNQ